LIISRSFIPSVSFYEGRMTSTYLKFIPNSLSTRTVEVSCSHWESSCHLLQVTIKMALFLFSGVGP